MLPSLGEAIVLPGYLVQEVPVGAGGDTAGDVWPPGGGPDLPRLRQDGPLDVCEPGQEGVHLGGHLPPSRRGDGVGGGGGLAGGVIVPQPAPRVACRGVGPAGSGLSLEECEAAARAEVLAVGEVPTLHQSVLGRQPHRHAGLLLPQWRQVPAPRVGEAGAAVVRPGGARKEDPGVPPLQCRADGGPLGPKLGAIRALDGGQPDRAVHARVVGVPPPIPRPGEEVPQAQEPRAQPLEGGKATGGAGPPSALVGGEEHLVGLAAPSPQQGEAMLPPPAPRARPQGLQGLRGARGGGGGGQQCPRPHPGPRPRGPGTL